MKLRYEAIITGDAAPFRWQLQTVDSNGRKVFLTGASGEADSFVEAQFDAAASAHEHEARRRHSTTKETVVLFEVEGEPVTQTQAYEGFAD